uniref:JmjC domain-containing protein n=1 Tax=Romanomermis culicivorax TaxID=13658 RepID=A0A915L7K9_ROMCU
MRRKRWTLFPPRSTPILRPTRLPYEESSVFSRIDLLHAADDETFVEKSAPRMVILEPGDILLVPKHWWHFVQCLDDGCISVNTWVDLQSDRDDKLSESIISAVISMTKNHLTGHLLNINDDGPDLSDIMNLINAFSSDAPNIEYDENPGDQFLEKFLSKFSDSLIEIPLVNRENYKKQMESRDDARNKIDEDELNERSIVDAIVNAETIAVIKRLLLARKNK